MKISTHFLLIFLIWILLSDSFIESSKILALFPVASKSLHFAGERMAEILSENKRHEVIFVSPFESSSASKDYKHVFLSSIKKHFDDNPENFFDFDADPFSSISLIIDFELLCANLTLNDPALKNLLKTEHNFDLVILDVVYTEYLMYIADYYKAPLLLYMSLNINSWANGLIGNPAPPSYVPHFATTYTKEMKFFERLTNFAVGIYEDLYKHWKVYPFYNELVRQHFPNAPDLHEYIYKNALIMVNSDNCIDEAVPRTPGVIDVGGFHIKPAAPLPKDLEEIADNAHKGLIFFSLGSNVESAMMPKETIEMISRVFSNLEQTVLWKFEKDLPNKPKNVIIRKWLPQNDILAHKNTRLFITHAGWHSILETIYHGIPCVAMSVFMDQHKNGRKAAESGIGEWFKYTDLTEEVFEKALQKVLHNQSYTETVKKRSEFMKEKPVSPAKLIKFWSEFVIKHKGASHLQVEGVHLSWYRYLLLDVIAFVIVILISFILCLRKLFQYLLYINDRGESKEKMS